MRADRPWKMKRCEMPEDVRFLTFSCYDKLPLLKSNWAKDLVVDYLALARDRLAFRLYAWVIMPNHMHLLLYPDIEVATVRRIQSAFKTRTATLLLSEFRKSDSPFLSRITDLRGEQHLWMPGGGYDRNIHSNKEFHEKLDYIENNPVKSGLVMSPEGYRWSSAGSLILGRDIW